jgi:hypothetical protein
VQGLGLMGVQPLDPDPIERREHVRVQLRGQIDQLRPAGAFARLAHEPLVRAALVQERGPRLDLAFFARRAGSSLGRALTCRGS